MSRRACLAGAASWLTASVAHAQPADDVIARIARARARVHTLHGPFTQIRTIGLLATDVRSRGTLTLVRPDRLRWELEPPDAVTFWMAPEGLAYRSAHGAGRLGETTARIGAALDDMRTLLGGDLTRLRERWDVRTVREDATGIELEAAARGDAGMGVRVMRFALAADLVRPTRILLVEGPRDRTSIEFGALAVDAPVDESSMRPPP